jgi:hypothetical protein
MPAGVCLWSMALPFSSVVSALSLSLAFANIQSIKKRPPNPYNYANYPYDQKHLAAVADVVINIETCQ